MWGRVGDVLGSLFLVLPLVIAFWRGLWGLMDSYCDNGYSVSVLLGYSITFSLYFFQGKLKDAVKPGNKAFYPLSRSLLLLHSFGSVNQWRGFWVFIDLEWGKNVDSAVGSLLLGIAGSVVLRTFSNVLAPPLNVFVDEAKSIHDCQLRFDTKWSDGWRYFLDCFVSVFIAASLVVSSWRGLWVLGDLFLFPDDKVASALASIGIGYSLVILLLVAHEPTTALKRRLNGFSRLVVVDVLNLFGFIGCVFAWRGLWMIYDKFIVFEIKNLSEWVTMVVGAVATVFLGCVSSVIVRGVSVDGVETGEWPISYFSLINSTRSNSRLREAKIIQNLQTGFAPPKTSINSKDEKDEEMARESEPLQLASEKENETKLLPIDSTTVQIKSEQSSPQ